MSEIPNKVVLFAKIYGFYGAEYVADWNEYKVYEPLTKYPDDVACIGEPFFILYNNGEVRFSSFDEYKNIAENLED